MREHDGHAAEHQQDAGEIDQRGAAQEFLGELAIDRRIDEEADADQRGRSARSASRGRSTLPWKDVLSLRRHDPDQVQRVSAASVRLRQGLGIGELSAPFRSSPRNVANVGLPGRVSTRGWAWRHCFVCGQTQPIRRHSGARHRSRVYPRSALRLPKSATADLGGASPESISPGCGYGFRAPSRSLSSGRASRGPVGLGPGMTAEKLAQIDWNTPHPNWH